MEGKSEGAKGFIDWAARLFGKFKGRVQFNEQGKPIGKVSKHRTGKRVAQNARMKRKTRRKMAKQSRAVNMRRAAR